MKTHRVYWSVLRPYRGIAIAVVLSAIGAGALEALGLATLLPILRRENSSSAALYGAFLVLGAFLVCSVALRALSDVQTARLNIVVEAGLREKFLDSVTSARWSALRNARSGDLVTALMSESSQVANGTTAYLASWAAGCIAVCLGLTALAVAPLVSLVAILFALASLFAYQRAGRLSRRNQIALAEAAADMNDEAVGLLSNLKLLFSTGDRIVWAERMHLRVEHFMALRRFELLVPVIVRCGVEALGATFLVAAMALTVLAGGRVSTALVTLSLFYRVIPRLQIAQSSFLVARTQSAWWQRWQDRQAAWSKAVDRASGTDVLPFQGPLELIELQDVDVRYPGRSTPALSQLTLSLRPGRVLAVVGHTGSGKSTFIDVLTGLIAPDRGHCSINGYSLVDLDLDTWQRQIGFVPQDGPILDGTLLENVVWLEQDTDRDRAAGVLAVAALDDFVATLPEGMDTLVGARGASLSGGQRQRLAIARALYRRPALLILDEATSGLDPATEQRLLSSLIPHCGGMAVVLVTHRLENLALAHDVVAFEEGRLVAHGPSGPVTLAALKRISAVAAPSDPA